MNQRALGTEERCRCQYSRSSGLISETFCSHALQVGQSHGSWASPRHSLEDTGTMKGVRGKRPRKDMLTSLAITPTKDHEPSPGGVVPATDQQKRCPLPQSTAGARRRGNPRGSAVPGPLSLTALSQPASGHQRMAGLFSTKACRHKGGGKALASKLQGPPGGPVCLVHAGHLDVELEVAPVHLSGHHALDDVHRHQLGAAHGRAADVVGFTLLDLQVEEPEGGGAAGGGGTCRANQEHPPDKPEHHLTRTPPNQNTT
ncbi:hypothetical protein EYF80_055635 [Liparis tanakae]|uniref:Uncharacterized protein n=1 Tax=Liparis tanakae TaxID=230148 RepID=A0A4Z2EZS6_9TELE|nr:hypothetical protein EYF80_055635 [Liparis tanakae]